MSVIFNSIRLVLQCCQAAVERVRIRLEPHRSMSSVMWHIEFEARGRKTRWTFFGVFGELNSFSLSICRLIVFLKILWFNGTDIRKKFWKKRLNTSQKLTNDLSQVCWWLEFADSFCCIWHNVGTPSAYEVTMIVNCYCKGLTFLYFQGIDRIVFEWEDSADIGDVFCWGPGLEHDAFQTCSDKSPLYGRRYYVKCTFERTGGIFKTKDIRINQFNNGLK